MNGVFVTGTDTEVGKTGIAAALLHLLAEGGARSAGWKPVSAGRTRVDGSWGNDDVRALRAAGSMPLRDDEVGPLQFDAACAPQVAARLEGRTIERAPLLAAARALAARCDWLVVEGVGGFVVPFDDTWDSADLARDLALPVLLVVGLRLGCINHALLTAEAVQSRGLRLAGWVGNGIDPAMQHVADNLASLRQRLGRLGAPCFGVVPHLPGAGPAAVASHLDGDAIRAALRVSSSAACAGAPPNGDPA